MDKRNSMFKIWLNFYVQASALIGMFLGIIVMIGWSANIQVFKSILPNFVSMKVNTALAFILVGFSLFIAYNKFKSKVLNIIGYLSAFVVIFIGSLTLIEYFATIDLGIDQFLFKDNTASILTSTPGRMSAITAICFILLGISLIYSKSKIFESFLISQILSLISFTISGILLLAYFYKEWGLLQPFNSTAMAVHTALLFVILSKGIIVMNPESGIMKKVSSQNSTGMLLRILLPIVVITPVLIEIIANLGVKLHLYNVQSEAVAHTIGIVVVLIAFIWITMSKFEKMEIKQKESEETLRNSENKFRTLINSTPIPLCQVDNLGNLRLINDRFTKVFGYTLKDIPTLEQWWINAYPDEAYRSWVLETWSKEVENAKLRNHDIQSIEYQVTCKNGSLKTIIISGISLEDGFLATFIDITARKTAEEERDRFFSVSLDLLCIAGTDGYFKRMNPAWEKHLGYSKEELTAKPFLEFIHPDDIQNTLFEVEKLKQGAVTINFINRYRCKDGNYKWLTWNTVPFGDNLYAAATDITEIKTTQELLTRSEIKYRNMVNNSPVSLWEEDWSIVIKMVDDLKKNGVTDFCNYFKSNVEFVSELLKEVKITDVNNETLLMFHATDKSQLIQSLEVVFATPDTLPGFIGELVALAEGKLLYEAEMDLRTVDGILINTFLRMSFPTPEDNSGRVLVSIMNITEIKKAEERVIETESRLQLALEVNKTGVWDLNLLDGSATRSLSHDQIFGYNELLPNWTFEMASRHVIPEDREFFQSSFGDAIANGKNWEFECRIRRVDGELRWIYTKGGGTAFDSEGKFIRMSGLVQDITERKQEEKKLIKAMSELERSNKELEQFAYVASHDLQEPLRMVSSYTQLLSKRYKDKLDTDANDFIAFAVDGATRMQSLINDLLTYSRISTKAKPFSNVDLTEILGTAIVNLQSKITENNAIIINDDLPLVIGDDSQLARLFQNLISNAIKYRSDSPPIIHIAAEKTESEWKISIRDNGIGIEQAFFEKIFIIFQRLHSRDEYPGTGMGLAICKRIVEKHGGKIWLESEKGNGTIFYFTLPIKGSYSND